MVNNSMSNGCCGWKSYDQGKEAIDFEEGQAGEYYTAAGHLPTDDMNDDFTRKITYMDEYTRFSNGDILGYVKGLEPIVKSVEVSLKDIFEGKPNPEEKVTFEKEKVSYHIEREENSQGWCITILGRDKYAVQLAANRINNRLSARDKGF